MNGPKIRISMRTALTVLMVGTLLGGLLPALVAVQSRLETALEQRSRQELEMAPNLISDWKTTRFDAIMMRAADLAHRAGLAEAVIQGDRSHAAELWRPRWGPLR